MMNTPYPDRDEMFAQLPVSPAGCDIASYPIIHQAAVDATYVACNPANKDLVLSFYAALGWQVENVTDDDYRNMQRRRVNALLLEAWSAAEATGSRALNDKVRAFYYDVEGRP